MLDYTEKEKDLLRKLIALEINYEIERDTASDAFWTEIHHKIMSLGYTKDEAYSLTNDATEIRFDDKAYKELFKTE